MRIRELTLPVSDIARSASFFRDVLELPADGHSIKVGWSRIQLIAAVGGVGRGVHLAFNVPYDRVDDAIAWLKMRVPLQKMPDGTECFTNDGHWQSRSVYFEGLDGAILELIGRRRFVGPSGARPFSGSDLACISEVGLPTESVEQFVAKATLTFAMPTFGSASPGFAAVGGGEALLIAVDPGRPWFPESIQLPTARGLEVLLDGVDMAGTIVDPVHGWRVKSGS